MKMCTYCWLFSHLCITMHGSENVKFFKLLTLYVTEMALIFFLTLNLLTTTIVAPPSNVSKWQMGFNSAFKGLKLLKLYSVAHANISFPPFKFSSNCCV